MSEELFPTRHKKNPNVEYVICKICNNEVSENQCKNGICRDCLNKGKVYRCQKCGKEILYTNYQKYVKNAKRLDVCPECFEYGNKVKTMQKCIDCGCQFEITNNQYDFYNSKGLDIPKRCKLCRNAKKTPHMKLMADMNLKKQGIILLQILVILEVVDRSALYQL